jgi:hypothetical protein
LPPFAPDSFDRERAVATCAFAVVALMAAMLPAQNDTWWHLRAGADTLQGLDPFVDRYSWTVRGHFFWNHSWLAQVLLYAAYAAGGLPLATAMCVASVTTGWWLVWRRCRGQALERLLILGVALPVATLTWSLRPQVFSILLLPVAVELVARNHRVGVAVLMALWANLHAGFMYGVIVLVAGIGTSLLQRERLRQRAIVGLVGLAATLATPLGIANWREIAVSLTRSQANMIAEWQPPGFAGIYLFFWLAAAGLVVGLVSPRRARLNAYERVSAVAALAALFMATRAMRHVPAFMMLAAPPLSLFLFGESKASARSPSRAWTALAASAVSGAVLGTAVIWNAPTPAMQWQPMAPAIRNALAGCQPPLVNTYSGGGPIIWFVPGQPVFVDSRQDPYPIDLVQAAMTLEEQGDVSRFLARYPSNCAALPPSSPAVRALTRIGWRRLAADPHWVVLERASSAIQ